MKSVAFDYVRAGSVEEACHILSSDENAQIIAGGQTLVPLLAMRLARPTRLVDIQRIGGLAGIRSHGGSVVIGATTRQAAAERSGLVKELVPLLSKALPWVGHLPTRTRGTVGGSVANADSSAEIPLILATLKGAVTVSDGRNARPVSTDDFFLGPMMTALPQGMCITELHFPVWSGEFVGCGFEEVNARKSDFAIAAAAAQVRLDSAGKCLECSIGIGGATAVPTRLETACESLVGSFLREKEVSDAVTAAVTELSIMTDLHIQPRYRRRAAAELAIRAVLAAKKKALGTKSKAGVND